MQRVSERIEDLRRTLERHNHKYYVENSPEISDMEFDALMRELQTLEAEHPELYSPTSPSVRVGSDIANPFQSVEHSAPMLSLANTYSIEELSDAIQRIEREVGHTLEYVCEIKVDGTAISLTYDKGTLVRAVTRGDGVRGDDVTQNVKTIRSVPLRLLGNDYPEHFEIRGEIFMPYSSFERLNEEREQVGEKLFANPRNAAAGTLKQQSSAMVAKRSLDCTLYQVVGDSGQTTHWGALDKAQTWGFKISAERALAKNVDQIKSYIERIDTLRHSLPYPMDGVVIKVNDFTAQRQVGTTAKAPKWAFAYKFKAERVATKLLSVTYQVGRTGAITPVANLEAVQLAGTIVKRASLHNAEQIAQADIRVGDMVYVEKGGEIIPKIVGVELSSRPKDSAPLQYITHCPECGTPLIKDEEEAKHYCPNQDGCAPQIVGRIIHFIHRRAMDIEGLGEETVELLYKNGLVQNIADIYTLKSDELAPLPRLGERSAENIINSIKQSCKVPFSRVLFGLGIRFVGETTAKYLAEHFLCVDAIMAASEQELTAAQEVGAKIATSIVDHFALSHNREIIERLRSAGVQLAGQKREALSDSLEGKSFVVSGKFTTFSRDEIKEMIVSHSGRNLAGVSANVDFLIAGEAMGPAKLKKAEALGIKIISEDEFVAMAKGESVVTKSEAEARLTVDATTDTTPKQGELF